MSRYQRIFLSDIHLSSQALYDSQIARYDASGHRSRLLNFFDSQILARSSQIKDLVLLGDIFDNWVCPANQVPPSYDDIMVANSEELGRLTQAIRNGINVFYIHGNHDYDLPRALLENQVPGLKVITAYKGAGRTHAEHGHLHTLFNCPDYLNDPGFGRPLGYYIARLHASSGHKGISFSDIVSTLDDVLEAALTPTNLIEALIEAVAERADNTTAVVMPGGQSKTITDIMAQYQNLAQQHKYGLLGLRAAIWEYELGSHADKLCRDLDFNVVLFGHTHREKIDKDFLFTEDRVYANTGAWCEDDANCVIVEKYPLKSGTTVKLVDVGVNGSITNIRTQHL